MTENELINLVKQNDSKALESLIDKYYPEIYRFVFRKVSNYYDACDIVQEIFVKLVNAIQHFKKGSFEAYLYTIARNVCIDYFRRKKRTVDKWDNFDEFDEMVNPQLLPVQIVEKEEEIQNIIRLLYKLSVEQRDVIILRVYHELGLKEISEILNIPLSRVKNRLYSGFERLKKEVASDKNNFFNQVRKRTCQ